jgi:integrase/recombinase XerD
MPRKKSVKATNGAGRIVKAYLEPDEVERMEKAATCFRDRLLIRFLSHLGCRISEALALKVEDIDFTQGAVTIKHLKTRLKLSCPECRAGLGRSHKFCPNCGSSVEKAVAQEKEHRRVRTLPVDDHTLEMLRDFITRDKTKGLIFKINRHRAWQVVQQCAQKAGLPDMINPETGKIHGVSPHRLRDCFAVMAVQRDDSTDGVRMLQEWLGHANIGTTMRYRKVSGQELRQWHQKLWKEKDSG